jgi:ComF family protein
LGSIESACPRCGEPGPALCCGRCARNPPPFRVAAACFAYREGEASSTAITRWKYRRDHVLGASLAQLFAERVMRQEPCYDVVVPVPAHSRRVAARGFDQAAILARSLSPWSVVAPRLLRRIAATRSQTALPRVEREANVRGKFAITDSHAIAGRVVLLVDDVFTSGATVSECARVLLEGGARDVDVWTLAHTADGGERAAAAHFPPEREQ